MSRQKYKNNKSWFFTGILLFTVKVFAQEIPLGTWRTHISYNSIHSITQSSSKIYGATFNGISIVDRADGSITSLNKLNGLSGTGITAMAFDNNRNQVVVGYADGNLDIVKQNEIINFNALKNSPTIIGSKRINQVSIQQPYAYLATDFGVVVFDLIRLEIKETWRDLGVSGSQLKIFGSTFKTDSIFLATDNGVIAGDLDDNLMDFNNWKRFNQGSFNNAVQSITYFNTKVYAAINGDGIYNYVNGIWTKEIFLQNEDFTSLSSFTDLLITTSSQVWKISSAGVLTEVTNSLTQKPLCAVEDSSGKLWIGDGRNGLVSNTSGTFQTSNPNGPSFSGSFRLKHFSGTVYALAGGFKPDFTPAGKTEYVNYFSLGNWNTLPDYFQEDVTGVDFSADKTYVSSFTLGLQVHTNTVTIFNSSNSPLTNSRVSAIASSAEGVWVANYNAPQPLHLLKPDNTWQSFSFPVSAAQYPVNLLVDNLGQVWMMLNPSAGGILVFNKSTNQHVYLTEAPGAGALPSRKVYALANDRNGAVWVGTDAGVAYFPDPSRIFSGNINSVKPLVNGRVLLNDEKTTAIAVDGGNRKWIGTERGVWLFDQFGETQLLHFNESNSPLLSDKINAIEIHPSTGEVFFATDAGIVSYRSDATAGTPSFSNIKIFPNPVTATFTGTVGITGLATDATVKITDVSGRLVWQTQANGSTATWNVRDVSGRRASTGIYLVIAISQDGSESMIGKIAVIN
ncbi:MAG: T9SS type A sorting domain-containing protein [Flammeovirgaceae bacterium]|nr:MAG: T9SS type A sorting domain-containing protein [Flammeovirgaceae bacterium]